MILQARTAVDCGVSGVVGAPGPSDRHARELSTCAKRQSPGSVHHDQRGLDPMVQQCAARVGETRPRTRRMGTTMKTAAKGAARWIALCVLATGLVLGGQAASFGGQAGAASSGGGVLTVGYDLLGRHQPDSSSTHRSSTAARVVSITTGPFTPGLLRETTSGAYVPDLASSVTIPNSTTIDIQVRPGLVYSNGTPLDAAAVKAGYERNLTNPNPAPRTQPFGTSRPSTSPGPRRWPCTSRRPWPAPSTRSWPTRSRSWRSRPGRARAVPNTNVVGAGPFVLKSYTPGRRSCLSRTPSTGTPRPSPTIWHHVHRRPHRTAAAQRARVRPG